MPVKPEVQAILAIINSLGRHQDTDLFPQPAELDVLAGRIDETVATVTKLDLGNYPLGSPRRFLVPTGELAYRQGTQLDPLDSVVFTALIKHLGYQIEDRTRPRSENSVFSYRFAPTVSVPGSGGVSGGRS